MAIKKTYMKLKKKAFGSKGVRGRYDPRRAGAKSLLNLYKDVKMIQSRLNVEKKYYDADLQTVSFGQVNANLEGFHRMDITPYITQGVGSGSRIGNSIKLTGISLPVQFTSQNKTMGERKIKMMLFRIQSADNGVDTQEAIADYLDVNPLNGIIDMGSQKAYRNHKGDGIKLIRQATYTLKAPVQSVAGNDDLIEDYESSGFTTKFNVKLNDVLRFNNNTDTNPDGTRYFLYFFCDRGNVGAGASTLDVPVKTPSSGVEVRIARRIWWVDN